MLNVDHLTKRYGPVAAVDGLSFEARPGRVTGFLGPNGAGKTTTLRILFGLGRPAERDRDDLRRPYRKNFGIRSAPLAALAAARCHPARRAPPT